ncbi:Outer membrane protein OmpA [Streptomyces zhaozhouensis]|uniref:Outer membrane protein OmpA n=1 Tax=Streptomyces zhaozhouensis TaxID=1300267 RepID=A0A286DU37_9ACTN|nr:OmpA family protein [Streptomyces zhaozhouensis]SOD62178.1 Outer membrane protein OmpA [Streptomyces zhaozhouensis]
MHAYRRHGQVAVVATTAVAVWAFGVPLAAADDDVEAVEQPPGYEAPAPPEIDPSASGLMLTDGATLAEPRVLDVKFIIEDVGGGQPDDSGEQEETPEDTAPPEEPTTPPEEGDEGQEPNGGGEQREERTSGQHKFTLQTDVVFGRNSDEITDESREALTEVAAAIEEYQPSTVNIFGFTDDLGSYENGVTLSENRARNTHLVLLEMIGDPDTIDFNVRGYSEDYPLYDNDTEEGRQQNRRVEISWPTGG